MAGPPSSPPELQKPKLLFVGAFPPADHHVHGGNITDCRLLLASSFPERVEVVMLDTTQRSVPPPPLLRRAVDALGRAIEFMRLISRERPDVALLFTSSGFSFIEKALLAVYAHVRGVPAILAVRSGEFTDACRRSPSFRRIVATLLRIPALVICQGETWQRFYYELFGMPASKCPIVDSWVATPSLLDIGSRRVYHEQRTLKLLFVGWIELTKGVFDLLEAVRRLVVEEGRDNVFLTLAGEGGAIEVARQWVCERGLDRHITFAGWVDGDSKLALFEQADAFVLPSYAEGLPNAMIEAMAAGLPPIVTPVGSVPDVIRDSINGLIVPPRDAQALTRAIRTMIHSASMREQIGRAAFAMARDRFGAERAAESLAELVTMVARQGKRYFT